MTEHADRDTLIESAPPESELVQLAELAFASRGPSQAPSHAPRNLVFLSPEALDMDLSDPMQRDFGDYELLEKIGRGGMGVVYRARQRSLDREVALKLLIAGPWAPTRFIERFRREAQSAARLEHPNIVTVYESGSQHDLNYFSMRLVRGESLAVRLSRAGGLPPREAARILRVVADAVDYAHQLGVLHLDLKPGNVLIDKLGVPLVADFGLARRVDHAFADTAGDASGTPSYMAPEQVDEAAHRIGRTTDIYGLGAILYELLCNRPPFMAGTAEATLERVLNDEVEPPRRHDPRIPRDLEAVCLKCLHKDPAERYATAADLADDLRAFLDDRPVSVRAVPGLERVRRWVRREPRLAAAVAAIALALTAGLAATAQQWLRAEASALAAREVNWEGRREAAIAFQQDGRGLEALARLVANLREQEEAGEADEAAMERLRIGLLRTEGAQLIDTILVADANPFAVAISSDGSLVAVGFNDLTLRWYDTDNLEEQGRVELAPVLMPAGAIAPWQTSDGKSRGPQLMRFIGNDRLLVTLEWVANYVSPTEADTWLVDLERTAIVAPPSDHMALAYSMNGQHALLADANGHVEAWQTTPWQRTFGPFEPNGETLVWLLAPGGRLAFALGRHMLGLHAYDLTGHRAPVSIALPDDAEISAWMLSPDGRQLALGNTDGRVFLLDTASFDLHPLPVRRGREITWLAFSDDGTWLALTDFDGLAQVVDIAEDDLLVSGEMRADFPLRRIGVSRAQRLLVAAGEGETVLWRIPDPSPRAAPAQRIGFVPPAQTPAARYPIAWSLEQGLLAGAGLDGQVRLWRLPTSPTVPVKQGRQHPDEFHLHAGRLIDAEWDQLRISGLGGHAVTEWLRLPQPAGFAELLDEGRLLIATVGTELFGFRTATTDLRPRYDPLPLPETPQRLLATDDGRFVLLAFGAHSEDGHEDRLRLVDARSGKWLPGQATLYGPSRRFSFSPDGRWIVAVGPVDGVTSVLRSEGLELIAEYPHDVFQPVVWARFRNRRLLLLTKADDLRLGSSQLLVWNPLTDEIERTHELGSMGPVSIIAGDDRVVVAGTEYDLMIPDEGKSIRLPRIVQTASAEPNPAIAFSADQRVLARALRRSVQLHDARSGALLGPPLGSDIPALGPISEVAFLDDDRHLRADWQLGRMLDWRIEPERSSIDVLVAELERLLPVDERGEPLRAPTNAERHRLRASDPGPWPELHDRPETPMAPNAAPGLEVPARVPGTSPLSLDLSSIYNHSYQSTSNTFWMPVAGMHRFPVGLQRIGGVDYDMRGIVQVGLVQAPNAPERETLTRIECFAVPAAGTHTPAVHLLVYNGVSTPIETGETLAELTLHYRDHEPVSLPLQAGHELLGYNGDDQRVPIEFATDYILALAGGPFVGLSAPRLVNPHPDSTLDCLDLELAPNPGLLPMGLFAITLEPVEEALL